MLEAGIDLNCWGPRVRWNDQLRQAGVLSNASGAGAAHVDRVRYGFRIQVELWTNLLASYRCTAARAPDTPLLILGCLIPATSGVPPTTGPLGNKRLSHTSEDRC